MRNAEWKAKKCKKNNQNIDFTTLPPKAAKKILTLFFSEKKLAPEIFGTKVQNGPEIFGTISLRQFFPCNFSLAPIPPPPVGAQGSSGQVPNFFLNKPSIWILKGLKWGIALHGRARSPIGVWRGRDAKS